MKRKEKMGFLLIALIVVTSALFYNAAEPPQLISSGGTYSFMYPSDPRHVVNLLILSGIWISVLVLLIKQVSWRRGR